MPSRVIRGDALASNSLSRVSLGAEHLFLRLLLAVDDYGRCDGRSRIIRNLCFPLRDDVSPEDVAGWIDELCLADGEAGPVQRYVVADRMYLRLVEWEKHRGKSKRADESRFPSPNQGVTKSPRIPADPLGPPRAPARGGVVGGVVGDEVGWGGAEGRATAAAAPPPPAAPVSADPALEPSKPKTRRLGREKTGRTDPPERLDDAQRASLRAWAAISAPEVSGDQLLHAEASVLDWARSGGKTKRDWVATIRNALRDGWALRGYISPHPKQQAVTRASHLPFEPRPVPPVITAEQRAELEAQYAALRAKRKRSPAGSVSLPGLTMQPIVPQST